MCRIRAGSEHKPLMILNMQNKNIIIPFAFAMIVLAGCDNYTVGPTEKNTVPPGRVTDIQVENLPGQARLTYKLPTDPDLLYVKAVYPLNSGEIREIKASYYTNTMLLDGFGDTEIHEVEVYAVFIPPDAQRILHHDFYDH